MSDRTPNERPQQTIFDLSRSGRQATGQSPR